jgi:hypothetical protein
LHFSRHLSIFTRSLSFETSSFLNNIKISFPVSQESQCFSIMNRSLSFQETIALYPKNHANTINLLHWQEAEILLLKQVLMLCHIAVSYASIMDKWVR